MNLGDFLKNLAIDSWYKAVLYLGAVILVLSLFIKVQGISNAALQLISGGALLVGLGEWKNHQFASWIKPPNVYTGGPALFTQVVRKPNGVGISFQVVGCLLVALGLWHIVRS